VSKPGAGEPQNKSQSSRGQPSGVSTKPNPGSIADAGSRREHLTRARVVAAALAIVDRDGLDGLTMRALGRELGVDPMAAYHWFPNKPAILQGVGEAILSEIALPSAGTAESWQTIALEMGRGYHATLLGHPNALPVASTQPVMTPRGFELIERVSRAMVDGGLTPGAALWTINTVAAFVIGFAVMEVGVTPGSEPIEQETILGAYAAIDPAEFPTMVAAMAEAGELLSDDAAQFETALDAMVRGLDDSFRSRGLLR
jgi:TetR/AcrR family transcriptional regulator, tetracycline repressor protein